MVAFIALDNVGIGANLNWGLYEIAFVCAMMFFALFSLQISIASWMLEPLSDASVDKVAADGRYKWITLGIFVGSVVLGVLIAQILGG